MGTEQARAHLARHGRDGDVVEHAVSSATVELAAAAIGTQPERIAKTISLYSEDRAHAVLVVVAGDARIANAKFRARFGHKPRMLAPEDVEPLTGHAIGGVCPFGNPAGAEVWLDDSLRRFEVVHPAAGSANSSIAVTPADLESLSGARGWVDVTRLPD